MPNRYSPGQGILATGAPLRKTTTLNSILESAEDFQRRRLGDQGPGRRTLADSNRCKVKNNSGADRRRGEILEFNGFALADDQVENALWLTGGSPALTNGFGVLVRATPSTVIDDCQVAGVCFALVNVTDADHRYARVTASTYVLQSVAIGPVKILYKPNGTGEKKCAVELIGMIGEILVKNASGGDYAENSGPHTFQAWGGTPGSEAYLNYDIAAYVKSSVAFKKNTFGAASLLNGHAYAVPWQT